jgi:acyl-CoA thioesterase YciA
MNGTAEPSQPPTYEPAIRAMPMPADSNQNGDIFGGWVLSQMDVAGGQVAAFASSRCCP